ncbi:MAG TPA: hypothetical protein VHE30_04260 [Polyangiaceae bacterium]|nr:hypothetical protein [Polyangiaceae bacterium]
MLGLFGKRAIDLAVLFLAAYTFVFVPLGRHTGLEHLKRILATSAARSAGHEIVEAADRLKGRVLGGDGHASSDDRERPVLPRGNPSVPRLPRGHAPANAAVAPAHETADGPDASL